MHERAGTRALPEDLINVDDVISAYYDIVPDPTDVGQRVAFGTSGHRGASLDGKFNEAHIIAITAAIIEYRASQGFNGPLFIGRDTHALSEPAWRTALEVLAAAGIDTRIDSRGSYTPTPAVSVAILGANGAPANLRTEGDGLADGIVVTPSHNPPRDGGFKYNPPHGGPADTDATGWIAARANELLDSGEWKNVPRVTGSDLLHDPNIKPFDYLEFYVSQLDQVVDIEAIRKAGVRIGADPLGGASIDYWAAIGEHYGLDLTVVNPEVDPAWPFMTLDWDGKIRMDCSSPYAMASLREAMTPDAEGNTPYDIATGNDADSDRHGIVTPDGLMNPNHFLAVAIEYLFTHRPGWSEDAAVTVVMASGGYPGPTDTGHEITGIEAAEELDGVHVIHAGTSEEITDDPTDVAAGCCGFEPTYALVNSGGRVLDVVARAATLDEARALAYRGVDLIHFDGEHHRSDIATWPADLTVTLD